MRSLFREMAKEKQLELQFSVSGSTPISINTDRSRLEQILKNLLSNAIKFTAKGYIQLRIEPNTADPDFIDVIVKDTGIGIAPEKQEHIFGAFQQADGSTRRKYGGTGLGLAISRRSEEHTSELQSLMRTSYAVFCLKKKKTKKKSK